MSPLRSFGHRETYDSRHSRINSLKAFVQEILSSFRPWWADHRHSGCAIQIVTAQIQENGLKVMIMLGIERIKFPEQLYRSRKPSWQNCCGSSQQPKQLLVKSDQWTQREIWKGAAQNPGVGQVTWWIDCLIVHALQTFPTHLPKSPSLFCLASNTMILIHFTSTCQSRSGAYDSFGCSLSDTHTHTNPFEPVETSSLLAVYSFGLNWFFPRYIIRNSWQMRDAYRMPSANLADLNRPGKSWKHVVDFGSKYVLVRCVGR